MLYSNMDYVKVIFGGLVGGALAGAVMLLFMPAPVIQEVVAGATSSVGVQSSTAKWYSIAWTPSLVGSQSNGAATTTSLYNGDSVDRIIQDVTYSCSGIGTSRTAYTGAALAALVFTAATTSTANPASIVTTNAVLNTTVATSSAELYIASTTPGLTTSAFVRRWAAGSYLTFAANATNTAACTIGVHTISS